MADFKIVPIATIAFLALSLPVLAEGDAAKGENDFKKCRSCHAIFDGDDVIQKGGKTGPNLFDVVGRVAGTDPGFKYSPGMIAAGEGGLIWTEEEIAKYVADPTAFLREITGDASARAKMTFKMTGAEDVAAYLATVSPDAPEEDGEGDGS